MINGIFLRANWTNVKTVLRWPKSDPILNNAFFFPSNLKEIGVPLVALEFLY